MSTFKVGQRVRIVSEWSDELQTLVGREGVVTDIPPTTRQFALIVVQVPGLVKPSEFSGLPADCVQMKPENLRPILDPFADAFVESIKQMRVYEEPTVRKVTA